jgi:hypothetical protein
MGFAELSSSFRTLSLTPVAIPPLVPARPALPGNLPQSYIFANDSTPLANTLSYREDLAANLLGVFDLDPRAVAQERRRTNRGRSPYSSSMRSKKVPSMRPVAYRDVADEPFQGSSG